MLDLDAGVAFDEAVLARLRGDEEFHGARVDVLRSARQLDRIGQDSLAYGFVEGRCRRDLDDLLMAKLYRAVALEEVHYGAARVRQDLHLDVSGSRDELLDEHRAVPEGRLRLALTTGEGFGHRRGILDGAHATSAAACGCLEHDRVAEVSCHFQRFLRGLQRLRAAGHDRNSERACERARSHFVAEEREHGGRRTDEDQALGGATLGEHGVLGKKSVARMDGVAAARLRRADERVGIQVGPDGFSRSPASSGYLASLGGVASVQRERVDRRIHADGFHAERGGRFGDADGDLAAVTDQNALQQSRFLPSSGQ